MRRDEIMADCPEEFEDRLKEIVDGLEEEVKAIASLLEITCVSELYQINDAFDLADKLCSDLY